MPVARRITSWFMSILLRMKKWNCTHIDWNREYTTNITNSMFPDQGGRSKPPHSFRFMIQSQPDGSGYGEIIFNPRSMSGLCLEDKKIANDQLQKAKQRGLKVQWKESKDKSRDWYDGVVYVYFGTTNGRSFTDQAITIARNIGQALGLSGEALMDWLSRFKVSQQTLILHEGKWVGFADYLRYKHDLQDLRGSGWSD